MNSKGNAVPYGAKGLEDLAEIRKEHVLPELAQCEFKVACDVTNPLCGPLGASAVYGPQKGATPEMVREMDQWLADYAKLAANCSERADAEHPGTGAAGGLGFAFLTFTNAVLESGIKIVLEETKLEQYIQDADIVITGEGRLDGQTAMGKAPVGVAKLAGKYKLKGKKPLLVACDVYRPAAIKQLQINGEKQGVEVFSMGDKNRPADIAKAALAHAQKNGNNIVILDTAGRLHIDEDMMAELQQIKEAVEVHQTILVVDAMTGQDAVNVAESFHNKIGIDGVIVTKLDGDTRGGAALSIKAVTGRPILYVGMGEKLSDLEQFYPDRMASRILGMGDVLTLIEKAGAELDEEKAMQMADKMKKAQFDFEDYLMSMEQMRKMGGLSSIMSMMPGLGGLGGKNKLPDLDSPENDKKMARMEAIIYSMTPEERKNPDLLNPSRKHRIAKGAGVDISEVNRMVKQFNESRKMMKKLPGMMGGKGGKKGRFRLPF